jgi:hypothetical protein
MAAARPAASIRRPATINEFAFGLEEIIARLLC